MSVAGYPADPKSAPGDLLRSRIWWLIIGTALSSFIYSATVASKGRCAEGIGANGGYIDAAGSPTDAMPRCLNLQLHPNPAVHVTIVGVAVLGLLAARTHRDDETKAVSVLGGAMGAIAIIAIGSFILGHIWFGQISLENWDGSARFNDRLPFVVADSSATISPIGSP